MEETILFNLLELIIGHLPIHGSAKAELHALVTKLRNPEPESTEHE